MGTNDKAIEVMAQSIIKGVTEGLKNASYDKSIRAKITNVLGNNKYEITKNDNSITVTSINGSTYNIGDSVVVTFIENIKENGIILGKF